MSLVSIRKPFGAGALASPLALAGGYGIDAAGVERAYHELGINIFFISPRFQPLIEGVRRLVKAGHRDDLVLISGANVPVGFAVSWEAERIAKMLEVERIDLFLLFWVQAHWYVTGKTWTAMQRLKASGKVGALGVSIHDRPMARRLVDELQLDALMIRYNAAHRGAEWDIFSTLERERRPRIIAYTATRWGKLLEPVSGIPPMTGAECYRFALSHPMVDVVLSGASSYAELADNAEGIKAGPLSEARMEEVHRFGDAVRGTITGRFGFGNDHAAPGV